MIVYAGHSRKRGAALTHAARSDEEGRASEIAALLRSDVTVDAVIDATTDCTKYSSSETNPLRINYGR